MNMRTLQYDTVELKPSSITDDKHPIHGDVTTFHDVVIASEIVQKYDDGLALKSGDELMKAYWTAENRWVKVGGHPETPVLINRDEINGRMYNPRFVKNLKDHKTGRPNRRGILADVEIWDKTVSDEQLQGMKDGTKGEVSIGFFFVRDDVKGVVDDGCLKGTEYDYVQREISIDHLAAGIDNGRCPLPYCGIGADEIIMSLTADPFGGFKDFDDCMTTIGNANPRLSEESVRKICGALKAKYEEEDKDYTTFKNVQRMLLETALKLEELRKDDGEHEWWVGVDWKHEDYKPIFSELEEDIQNQIREAGKCPECDAPRTEAERAMSHFNISPEEWEELSEEEKQEYIDKLPPRGSGGDDPDEDGEPEFDEYELEYLEGDEQWTYAYKKSLPDSAYAYIESGCSKEDGKTQQSCRHMPIKDKNGDYDASHVRAALSALKGGRTGKAPSYASKAKGKVCAGARALKIESEVCDTEKKKDVNIDTRELLLRADRILSRHP